MIPRLRVPALIFALAVNCLPASAHPHVWIVLKSEVVYDAAGSVTGIRHAWTFDEPFSAFATHEVRTARKDGFTREELAPIAKENIESLKDSHYFTEARIDGRDATFADPTDYWFEYRDSLLTLHFVLPLQSPAKARALQIAVYDPLYYLDFTFAEKAPVALEGAPAGCSLALSKGQEITATAGGSPKEAYIKRIESSGMGWQFASIILVKCP